MSEEKAAETMDPPPPAEVNPIPNGKGHEPGEETTAASKTPPAEETAQQ